MKKEDIYVYVDSSNAVEMKRLLEKYNQPLDDIDVSGFDTASNDYHYLVLNEYYGWFVGRDDDGKVQITLSQLEGILKGDTFTLPEMWCIEVTNENIDVLGKWRSDGPLHNRHIGWYSHTPMNNKNGYNLQRKDDDYTEITFEQFKTYVLKQNNMKTNTISRTDLGKIHNIACSTWKTKIENLGSRNPFSGTIELTQSEVDEMFKAATPSQRPTLVNIFGEQSNQIDLTELSTIEYKINGRCILAVRSMGDYKDKGFYLDDAFKWEIVKDNYGQTVLIPTRK
jgi:hypothetical protein